MGHRDVVQQSVKFWNSPWAMNSVWENGRGVSARFFVQDDDLAVEVVLNQALEGPICARTSERMLTLSGESGSVEIPLPEEVVTMSLDDMKVKSGMIRLTVARRGLEGKLPE